MFAECFFREGTIKDSSCNVRRTVSGEALRKNTRFNRWDIRLTPKNGSLFLISTIFSRTGPGSLRRLPDDTPRFRNPASPRSWYAFTQRRIPSVLAPTSFDNKERGRPSSKCNFTQRSLISNLYLLPNRLSFSLFFPLTSSTLSMGSLPFSSKRVSPIFTLFLALRSGS
jgi:hypothetical protein